MKGATLTFVRPIAMPISVSPSALKRFDYASLDTETSQFVQQQTGEIRTLMKRTAQGIVEIGCRLIEVKQRLGHGSFGAWLTAEFEWSDFTARQFMNVAKLFKTENFSDFNIAPSALYELAAPSTPKAARKEALDRAKAGESITYTAAKEIKQKYATLTATPKSEPEPELELEPVSQPLPTPTPAAPPLPSSKLEIVAIRPQAQAQALEETDSGTVPKTVHKAPSQPGAWWRLGGQHLLYCGDPDSPEFLKRVVEEKVSLMLAFPSTPDWQPAVRARTRIIIECLPEIKDSRLFEDALETNLLLCSDVGEVIVSCFLPSAEILSVINRLDRRGLFAEPDFKRVLAIISDWKKAGLKVERVN